ncbi:hypothetical protein SAMN05216388_100788 [Halorientalis persicus]|uniref:PGF-CTERM protein n=1 Tax=Halorientalis persicus TaxID=1367881 RepID=A0A1H8LCG0_9EURY|nr:PGF-CTERM sorting domain-containing protein [Halorientalis persicus]SEO02753.1 hypothetical protein SAMN05216388_100788 [Halorientalis persicus]
MHLKSTLSGLALVALLAIVLAGSPAVGAAGSPVIDGVQSTNETVTNETADETANATTPTVGNLTTWVGSNRALNLTDPAAVRAARRDGRLRRNATASRNETLVIEAPAPELATAVATANGSGSDATTFLRVLDGSSYDFRMEQTYDSTPAGIVESRLNLSGTVAADGLQVVPDERNGTLFLVFRVSRIALDYPDTWRGSDPALSPGMAFEATLSATGDTAQSSTTVWRFVEPPISFDTDAGSVVRLSVSGRCSLVTGRAYPGADVDIDADVRSPESDSLDVAVTTETRADGWFAACVNMMNVPQNVTLRLTGDGFRGGVTAVVGHGGLLSIALDDQNATNGTVSGTATLSDPGFVALYRARSIDALTLGNDSGWCSFPPYLDRRAAESRLVGVSDHLGPGQQAFSVDLTTDLDRSTRLLALVHYDRDEDGRFDYPGGDFPQCSNRQPVSDTARISPVTTTPPGTETETDGGNREQSATAPTTSHVDGPGFGLAVAALALVAVALLARRRS